MIEWLETIDWPVIAIIAAGIIVVTAQILWQGGRRQRAFGPAATKLGGRVTGSTNAGYSVSFTLDGSPGTLVCIEETPKRAGRTTLQLEAKPGGELRVMDHGLFTGLVGMIEGPDLQTGDLVFDADYRVHGEPEPWVRATLDDLTRARIVRLGRVKSGLAQFDGIEVRADDHGVRIEVRRDLARRPQALAEFAAEGLELLKRLRN